MEEVVAKTIIALLSFAVVGLLAQVWFQSREVKKYKKLYEQERMVSNHALYLQARETVRNLTGEKLSGYIASRRERIRAQLGHLDKQG